MCSYIKYFGVFFNMQKRSSFFSFHFLILFLQFRFYLPSGLPQDCSLSFTSYLRHPISKRMSSPHPQPTIPAYYLWSQVPQWWGASSLTEASSGSTLMSVYLCVCRGANTTRWSMLLGCWCSVWDISEFQVSWDCRLSHWVSYLSFAQVFPSLTTVFTGLCLLVGC